MNNPANKHICCVCSLPHRCLPATLFELETTTASCCHLLQHCWLLPFLPIASTEKVKESVRGIIIATPGTQINNDVEFEAYWLAGKPKRGGKQSKEAWVLGGLHCFCKLLQGSGQDGHRQREWIQGTVRGCGNLCNGKCGPDACWAVLGFCKCCRGFKCSAALISYGVITLNTM
jgi:hypothetical protein